MVAKKKAKKPARSGPSLTTEQRRANGQKLLQGLWLPADLVADFDRECKARGMTRTSAVQGAIRNWLWACKQARANPRS